ncbi:Helix-turn-helix domain-containing protein [Paenibacillus sp. UNCCL117]|uniref:helix-turn-helix domain-containing protein n=1 Tax=unclassified Paenibacillus TaxID=185978 RepID=UPI0008854006|nr:MULTISPECIES: AraC family transcriptional regulator [unclassified Paenibacillus]SDD41859.1 Helix-turn-helix domain-containing protein [Paenibacillus sp. cl123]SFW47744.1 Helix-turn-helix domain-containing protein [Paenibacillus sp. UNCCL117]
MKTVLLLKLKARSLFFKLFVGFLSVIVLLVSFHLFSLTIYRDSIREEIIRYNTQNMRNTADSFEKHFQLVSTLALGVYLNDKVRFAAGQQIDYVSANQVIRELVAIVSNSQLHLDNLLLFDDKTDFVLEKTSGSQARTFFSQHFYNEAYPYEFWREQFKQDFSFRIYPAASFVDIAYGVTSRQTDLVFPMIVKSDLYPEFKLIAMLDVQKMFQAFHHSINNNFVILDREGHNVFSSVESVSEAAGLPVPSDGEEFVRKGSSFYFYRQGPVTGLTYVNIVPDAAISSKIAKLNLTLLAIMLLSVVIGVAMSFLLSKLFNNPVRGIVESIRDLNRGKAADGPRGPEAEQSYNEFEFIRSNLDRMRLDNETAHEDLQRKNSLLRSYMYLNKLKKIQFGLSDSPDIGSSVPIEGPYMFVLLEVTFKPEFHEERAFTEERATYFLREYVTQSVASAFPESQTFQTDARHILSLVFSEERERLLETLEQTRRVLDMDSDYCFMTMAVSSVHRNAADFTIAYEEVLELADGRPFDDQTRIVTEAGSKVTRDSIPPALEQEFEVNLPAGNVEETMQAIRKMIAFLMKKAASGSQMYRFAEYYMQKTVRLLVACNLQAGSLQIDERIRQLSEHVHTAEQLEEFFRLWIEEACAIVRSKKEERDSIVSFVMDYVEANYDKDITLDLIAERLGITGGYLSSYFKEKTGINFLDYVNDARVKKVIAMLEDTELRIQDIALRAGYQNMNSFNRMFKKFTGVTPSEYRRSKRQV